MLFQGNELPGPGQYTAKNAEGPLKNWQSNIGAFGTTEKRFMKQQSAAPTPAAANPGPGEYDVSLIGINAESKYVNRRIRGKSMKVKKPDTTNSVFKSTTGRLLKDNIKKAARAQVAAPGQYEPSMMMGKQPIQGGAPNNFLLMKNEKLVAPFQSTVTRFKSQEPPDTSDYGSK